MPVASKIGEFSLDRMVQAVENVRNRLLRATAALEKSNVPYAVADDNAVAAHMSVVDPGAVRNTPGVYILIRRDDLTTVRTALAAAGFVYRHAAGIDLFLDGPDAPARSAVHIVYSREKIGTHNPEPNPDVSEAQTTEHFRVLSLEPLVRMKLAAFRRKDRVHLRDLIEVGLIDNKWVSRLPPELAERLRHLLDTPDE